MCQSNVLWVYYSISFASVAFIIAIVTVFKFLTSLFLTLFCYDLLFLGNYYSAVSIHSVWTKATLKSYILQIYCQILMNAVKHLIKSNTYLI